MKSFLNYIKHKYNEYGLPELDVDDYANRIHQKYGGEKHDSYGPGSDIKDAKLLDIPNKHGGSVPDSQVHIWYHPETGRVRASVYHYDDKGKQIDGVRNIHPREIENEIENHRNRWSSRIRNR